MADKSFPTGDILQFSNNLRLLGDDGTKAGDVQATMFVRAAQLAAVAFNGDYNALENLPVLNGRILTGAGAPPDGIGDEGTFYFANDTKTFYGPKSGGTWPAGIPLVSTASARLLNGSGAPAGSLGNNGDFYFASDTKLFYGPKLSGSWPAGIPLAPVPTARMLSGTSAPGAGTGNIGDFYYNPETKALYGPKTVAGWGAAFLIAGVGHTHSIADIAQLQTILDEINDALLNGGVVTTPPRTVTTDTTLVNSDILAKAIVVDAPLETDVTIPTALTQGDIEIIQQGSGTVTVLAASGVTLNVPLNRLPSTAGINSTVRLVQTAPNTYSLSGDLATITAPVVVAATFSLAENLPAGTFVGKVGTTGGFPTTFSIIDGNTNNVVAIDNEGNIVTTGTLDYETLSSYTLTVRATNTQGSSTNVINFNVVDVAEAPVVRGGLNFFVNDIAEIGAEIGLVIATDAPTAYEIVNGDEDDLFAISNTGRITLAKLLDGTSATSVVLSIRAQNAVAWGQPANVVINIVQSTIVNPINTFFTTDLIGSGAPAGKIATFGMFFAPGELLTTDTATLYRVSDDTPLRTQMDTKGLHGDGSVATAWFAVECPAMSLNARLPVKLVKNSPHPSPGADLSLATVLSNRTASVNIGSQAINLKTSLPTQRLRNGPLATQARVQVDVASGNMGGSTGGVVFADIMVLKDGEMEVDVALGNIKGLNAGTSNNTTIPGVTIVMDGQQKYSSGAFQMFRYQRFVRRRMTVVGGATAPERPILRPPVAYLARVGAIVSLDVQLGCNVTTRDALVADMSGSSWNTPMNNRGLQTKIGTAGGNADIGSVPRSIAAYLLTGDRELEKRAHDTGEASNCIPWHQWIMANANNSGQTGNWINDVEQPGMWLDYRGTFFPNEDNASGWTLSGKISHIPNYCGVFGVLAARASLIDDAIAEGAYVVNASWNARWVRGDTAVANYANGERVNVIRENQGRGAAWALNALFHAMLACPPNAVPGNSAYFRNVVNGNMQHLLDMRASMQAESGQTYGYYTRWVDGDRTQIKPWQVDYFNSTMCRIARVLPKAREYQEWSINFNAGRFIQNPANFYPSDGVAYSIPFQDNVDSARFTTWLQIKNRHGGNTNGPDPSSFPRMDGNYGANGLMAISLLKDLFPQDWRVAEAFGWGLNQPQMPFTDNNQLRTGMDMSLNVAPLGSTRASVPVVVRPNQTLPISKTAPVGTVVGVALSDGSIATSWAFVGSSAGESRFSISRGGVIRVAQSLTGQSANSFALEVRATSRFSSTPGTGIISLGAVALVPVINADQNFNASESMSVGQSAGTLQVSNAVATSFNITSGNTNGAWSISSSGQLILAANVLNATNVPSYTLTVVPVGVNGNGAAVTIMINVIAAQAAPIITNQIFNTVTGKDDGDLIATVVRTGGIPDTWAITAGNTDGDFEISNTGQIIVVNTLDEVKSYALTVTATNPAGTSTATVTINVEAVDLSAPATLVDSMSGTDVRAAYGVVKVRNSYTGPSVRAWKRNTNTFLDIGFSNGILDVQQLGTFANGGPTEAVIVYDHMGNAAHNMISTGEANYLASTYPHPYLTDSSGNPFTMAGSNAGRPAMVFDGGPNDGSAYPTALRVIDFNTGGSPDFGALFAMQLTSTSHANEARVYGMASTTTTDDWQQGNNSFMWTLQNGNMAGGRALSYTPNLTTSLNATVWGHIMRGGQRWLQRNSDKTTLMGVSGNTINPAVLRLGFRKHPSWAQAASYRLSQGLFFSTSTETDTAAAVAWMRSTFGF